ncbi:hypothetical protein CJP74_01575 [Psittacicella melopsittaci]|uniref:Glycosyl transferase family 8 n=1 Tax=Psittacicella melopsittaci TaxID=2028576 RepID=A0A3A1Y5P3_9GAMM|nr:glycosyltransferase [Psittacicella melopsittaci]RIY33582.1 hypothetical protein CJP74_01575 [Psittacicella melopsittaci]
MTKYKQQVLLTTDAGFIQRLPNFIKNLIAFNRDLLDIYIITSFDFANSEYKSLFTEFDNYPNCKLHFHYVTPEQRFKYEQVDYANKDRANAMSLRLYATELKLTGRLLYLDADILCTAPFAELFDDEKVDLQGKTLGVVTDYYLMAKSLLTNGKAFKTKLSGRARVTPFDSENPYFNSGFLLIDMDKLNASNLWLNHIAELKDYDAFPDQDLLNVLHFNDKVELSSKYNYLAYHLILCRYFFMRDRWHQVTQVNRKKVRHQAEQENQFPADYPFAQVDVFKKVTPTFLHFAGSRKQWNSHAQEFVDAYNLFTQNLEQILAQPVSYYEHYFATLFKVYDYLPVLNDYQDSNTFADFSLEKYSFYFNSCKPWTFNPILLNTRMYPLKSLKVLLRNAMATKGRDKLNAQEYSTKHPLFVKALAEKN